MLREYDDEKARIFKKRLTDWWTKEIRGLDLFPWRRESDPYKALITEVLLQRTRAETVKTVYVRFFQRFPDPARLAAADEYEIQETIAELGLRKRCSALKALGSCLVEGVPMRLEDLLRLPGIGEYSARAFLSLHGNIRASVPDTNFARIVGTVLGLAIDKKSRRRKAFLSLCERITPKKGFREFNFAILDFARMICRPRKPLCERCFIADLCRRDRPA